MLTSTKYFASEYMITEYTADDVAVWGWRESKREFDTYAEAEQFATEKYDSWVKYLDNELSLRPTSDHVKSLKKNAAWKVEAKEFNFTHVSEYCYTDVKAYEIVKVISDKTIEIRPMDVKHDISHLEQVSGGFCGHVGDQRNQKVTYKSDPEAPTIRIRKKKASDEWAYKGRRFGLQEKPYAFYDFNF